MTGIVDPTSTDEQMDAEDKALMEFLDSLTVEERKAWRDETLMRLTSINSLYNKTLNHTMHKIKKVTKSRKRNSIAKASRKRNRKK